VWLVIVPLLLIAPAGSTIAAELKEAHVTRIIKDVQLLPSQAAPRPAVVNDNVRSGTAVRTGADSRTELTFTDLTLARLGANTIFSFNEGTRNLDLGGGAVLLHVPKGAGGAKITTAAITAGITGTTVLMEYHRNAYIKFIVLEGTARMYLKNHLGESVLLGPGQMLIVKPNATSLPDPVTVDLKRLVQTCLLITEFEPLASQSLILQQIQIQQNNRDLIPTNLVIYGRGTLVSLVDPTNVNVISQATAAIPIPVPIPSEFGPPSVISSPIPYVITSGTTISTDPTITTNGVTDFGKIYRGQAQDGPLSAFIFGSKSAFDIASGFDTELNGQNSNGGAVFKFTSLQLTGNPTILTPTGVINLGLIAVNGITSGGPGGILTFAGIRGLLIATQDGSINLGPEISFSGLHDINSYARGAGSNLTLGSAISSGQRIRLWAQGTIQINGHESATDFRAFSGGDFLAGSGTITAQTIDIESLSNINIDSRQFPNFTGNFNVNAAGTLNATLHPGSGGTTHFNGTSLTAQGNTINLQGTVNPTTFDLGSAIVSLTAGSGGIQAPNVIFANGTSLLLQATGDINIHGAQNGAGDTIFAGGAFSAQSDVSTKTLQAGTGITIGGSVSARDFIEAGTAINVSGELSALSVIAGTNLTAGDITVLDTTGPTSDGNVDISARDQISITNGVDINRRFAGASSGLDVLISAGTDLTAGSSLMVNVDNSVSGNLNTGANIALNAGGNLTVNGSGDLSLTVDNSGGGRIGTGGDISVGSGRDLTTGGGVAFTIQNTTGTINNGGIITLVTGGALSSQGQLNLLVENYDETAHPAGHIVTGGNISLTTGGNLSADSISVAINNRNGGRIDSSASLILNIGGVLTTLHNGTDFLGDLSSLTLDIANRYKNTLGSTIGSGATLDFHAGSASIGGDMNATISDRGGIIGGNALLNFNVTHDITVQGADDTNFQGESAATWQILNDTAASPIGGTIHGSANLLLSATNLTVPAGSLEVDILNQNGGVVGSGGTIDSDANITFNLTGNLTTHGSASFAIFNQNNGNGSSAGGTIGGNATLDLSANGLSIGGALDTSIDNARNAGNAGGNIGGSAILNLAVTGSISAHDDSQFVNNPGGTIGSDATITVSAGSISTTDVAPGSFDVSIENAAGRIGNGVNGGSAAIIFGLTGALTTASDATFSIDNSNGGRIGSSATISVTAANVTASSLLAQIDNTGGSIGGNATINMDVSGNTSVTTDATVQILGSDGAGSAAINFNGGSYAVGSPGSGGTFLANIDGNGTITFNNASVHADVIKAGVFGANGVLNIGGGVLTADSILKLYAPGSNGQLNFVANVTLDGISTKILAANAITIFNGVMVTIGDDISATVYTNHPNYSGFGGNGSTTGTFGGVGARTPLPLSQVPPFGLTGTSRGSERSGDRNIARGKTTGPAINVSSTDQLLSLLDGAAPGPGRKITIPASRSVRNSRNPSRINAAGRLKADRGALDIQTASSLPARPLPQ